MTAVERMEQLFDKFGTTSPGASFRCNVCNMAFYWHEDGVCPMFSGKADVVVYNHETKKSFEMDFDIQSTERRRLLYG